MYEKPKLNHVGPAEDVVLGMLPTGGDVDTNYVVQDMEFADDEDSLFSQQL
jgi:hypothetical protein